MLIVKDKWCFKSVYKLMSRPTMYIKNNVLLKENDMMPVLF